MECLRRACVSFDNPTSEKALRFCRSWDTKPYILNLSQNCIVACVTGHSRMQLVCVANGTQGMEVQYQRSGYCHGDGSDDVTARARVQI